MKNVDILEQLNSQLLSYQTEKNSFRKVMILHDYFGYVKKSNEINSKLGELFKRADKNFVKIIKNKELENVTLGELGYVNGRYSTDDFIWFMFSFFFFIYSEMEDYKKGNEERRKEIEQFLSQEVTRPDLIKLTDLFFVITHQYLVTTLSKDVFINEEAKQIYFDNKKSILYFYGEPVEISKQQKKPVAHHVLEYLFSEDSKKFSEIQFKDIYEFEQESYDFEEDYKPSRYNTACEDINKKINNQTTHKKSKFLEFGTGKRSEVKINSKFRKDIK